MIGLAALYEKWQGCLNCDLCQTRISMVFGDGPPDADIVFVGSSPGKEEDASGIPFVGEAGKRLASLMSEINLSRDRVFITNVVACRSYVINEEGKAEDRDPTSPEIAACAPRLLEIIRIVDPVIILALGGVAFRTLTGIKKGITEYRGSIYHARIPGVTQELCYACLPMLHPAALNRNPDMEKHGSFNKATDDLIKAKKIADKAKAIRKGKKYG